MFSYSTASNQKLRKFFERIKMIFREIDLQHHRFLQPIEWFLQSIEWLSKNFEVTLLFIDFSKVFDSIHRGKMEQILLANGLPKETVTAIMMLYKNRKVKICSPNGDRFFLHCCWCSVRGYINLISVHNLPRELTSNVDRSNEREWF